MGVYKGHSGIGAKSALNILRELLTKVTDSRALDQLDRTGSVG